MNLLTRRRIHFGKCIQVPIAIWLWTKDKKNICEGLGGFLKKKISICDGSTEDLIAPLLVSTTAENACNREMNVIKLVN